VIAFVDESIRAGIDGMYVVGLVIAAGIDCDPVRRAFEGTQRFHFSAEGEARREAMLRGIGDSGFGSAAYVHRGLPKGQPRARRLCLVRLLWDLMQWGVEEVVFESRQAHNDRLDRIVIVAAQKSGAASPGLLYTWNTPLGDTMLWMADAIAGAVSAHIEAGEYREVLRRLGTEIQIIA
jgi:hypothetical protein